MRTKFNNKMRELMRQAWMLVKDFGFTLSEAMKQAWAIYRLVRDMHKGVVAFKFRKVDGSIREAHGTLAADFLPASNGSGRRPNPKVQVYFDTDKNEFRCFKINYLM